jgi:hypothetical protein
MPVIAQVPIEQAGVFIVVPIPSFVGFFDPDAEAVV